MLEIVDDGTVATDSNDDGLAIKVETAYGPLECIIYRLIGVKKRTVL